MNWRKRNHVNKKNTADKQLLFKRVHRNLTLLFTGIAGMILIVMSICYLYMSEKEWKDNSYLSFLNESNTILSNFKNQETVTYSWLSKVSFHNHFLMAVYDNGSLLSYSNSSLTEEEKILTDSIFSSIQEDLSFPDSVDLDYSTSHIDFTYQSSAHVTYYVNAARIGNSSLYAIILFSTQSLKEQLNRQRLRFLLVDLIGLSALFLFAFYYTKKLLVPIRENHEKQNAFIAAASHELRTPLAVILSSVTAFPQAETPMKEQLLQTIEKESRQMSTLINDMLTLAKADNHAWNFVLEETELDTLLLNSYEAFYPLAAQKDIRLQIELPDTALPACLCDSQRISQVLAILMSNALSYGKKGGYIKLSLHYSSPCFHLSVEDNGIGISDEAKKHIFDRFYREDPSRSHKEHFGLGLCIAKEIVDFHHGRILVKDTPGGGSTFFIILSNK